MAISYKKLFKLLIDRDLKKKDLKDMGQPLVTDAPNEHQTAKGDNLKEHNQAHPQEKGGDKHGDHHHKKSKAIPFKYHQEKKDGRNRLDIWKRGKSLT